jgi:mono/diheme cytochrome c family protein
MSNETLLFVFGIILAISAVAVCVVGLKSPGFPGKAAPIVVLWFTIFVVGSGTFAVLHAKDEEKGKAAESREAGKKAEEEAGNATPLGNEGAQGGKTEEAEEEVEGGEGLQEEGEVGPEEEPGGEKSTKGKEGGVGGEKVEAEPLPSESDGGEEGAGAEASAGGDPAAGDMVFSDNCSICHGADGHGGNGGPDLRTMPKAKTEAGAIEQVSNGGGGMPAFKGQLSEEEIADVAAYVSTKIAGGG